MSRFTKLIGAASVALWLCTPGCGGGGTQPVDPPPPPPPAAQENGAISGRAIKGPISSGVVTAYELNEAGGRGEQLSFAPTSADGSFTLDLGTHAGPLMLVVTAGTFVDEATGASVQMGSGELTAIVPAFAMRSKLENVRITPVSHFVTALAGHYMRAEHKTVAAAYGEAKDHLTNHFGALDWTAVTPADLGAASTSAGDAATAGVILGGLSELAKAFSTAANLSPGTTMNALALVEALHQDLAADGYFDGVGANGPIVLPEGIPIRTNGQATATRLDDDTVRITLGEALQAFVNGPRNASAVTANDVAPLIDALADASNPRLFRTPGRSGLDTTPPTVSFAATFSRDALVNQPPHGDERRVAGNLRLVVTAADPGGVASLVVSQGGTPVTPTSSSPTRFEATLDTTARADGTITFTADARDARDNHASATYTVFIDNTAPEITITAPSAAGFFSTVMPVAGSSADAAGQPTLSVSAPTGVADGDTSPNVFVGQWLVPTGTSDGPVKVVFRSCDVVGNCSTKEVTTQVDRTPPTLSLLTSFAPYSGPSQSPRLVEVDASDLAGVHEVRVRNGNSTYAAAFNSASGHWEVSVPMAPGTNELSVWGVDKSSPPNSGQGLSSPHQLTASTFFDSSAPFIEEVAAPPGGYRSEEHVAIAVDSDTGLPVMPPAYTNLGEVKPVTSGAAVYKVSTRLRWLGGPSAGELEGANASNTPFLQYRISYAGAQTDSPVSTVRFAITCNECPAGTPSATGDLLLSPTTSPGYVHYDLPINADTVPFLATVPTSPVTLTIQVTVTDAAGNVRSLPAPANLQFHLVAPPIGWKEDVLWRSVKDPQSVYGYRVADGTYDDYFSPSNPTLPADGGGRVLRYRVYNPFPAPVVVNVTPTSTENWRFAETWLNDAPRDPVTTQVDGFTLTSMAWTTGGDCPDAVIPPRVPCSSAETVHHVNGSPAQYACTPTASFPPQAPEVGFLSPGWDVKGYIDPLLVGDERLEAPSGYVINGKRAIRVPAASGDLPGTAVVYVVLPSRTRAAGPGLVYQEASGVAARYQYAHGAYWVRGTVRNPQCPEGFGQYSWANFQLRGWWRYLDQARFVGSGTFALNTRAVSDDGTGVFSEVGVPRAYATGTYATDFSLTPAQ